LGNQAAILNERGDTTSAIRLLKEQEGICRELQDKSELRNCLVAQALILQASGDLAGALKWYEEQDPICIELGKSNLLQVSLDKQAEIHRKLGQPKIAFDRLKQQERVCRGISDNVGLTRSLAGQACIVAQEFGRPEDALPLLEQAHQISVDNRLEPKDRQSVDVLLERVRAMIPLEPGDRQ
jgi:tetratricopeptide (TPR) repeat protein